MVKPQLDEVIGKIRPEIFEYFMNDILDNPDEWLGNDDDKVGHFISSCMEKIFRDQVNMTMNDYLRIGAPNAMTGQQFQNAVENAIIKPIYHDASAMFWCDPNFNIIDPNEAYQIGLFNVPAVSAEVCSAAESFADASESLIHVRKTDIKDRISAFRLFFGVPLCAYSGTKFMAEQYAASAGTAAGAGIHLYADTGRGKDGDRSGKVDWRTFLPSPLPYSLYLSKE